MNLLHIKLKNGEDLLAQEQVSNRDTHITVSAPVSIHVSPEYGFFARSWCHLTSINIVEIDKSETLFIYPASEKGYKYYEEFVQSHMSSSSETEELDQDELSDLEEMFQTILESKSSIKH